ALRAVPIWVDAERLDVDPLGVHLLDAVGKAAPQQTRRFERVIDDGRRLGNDAMGVDVDGLDPLAVDDNLAPSPRRRPGDLAGGRTRQAAADKGEAGERTGDEFP